MRRTLSYIFAAVMVAALAACAVALWSVRPWRAAVTVNGRQLSAAELDARARTMLADAERVESLMLPKDGRAAALEHYRREAAKMWIVKEVLLGEAVARGFTVSSADEKESLTQMNARLKSRGLTADAFFKEGPLPEEVKRRDFKEGVLINKFTRQEIRDKINITPQEINTRMTELEKLALLRAKPEDKTPPRADRKTAIDTLRAERFRTGFRELFRALFAKADITCPVYPEFEDLAVLSPEDAKK